MQETINKLREQPEEHRKAIAMTIAIGVVALLFAGWFLFFMHDLNKGNLEYERPAQTYDETLQETDPTAVPVQTDSTSSLAPTISTTSTSNSSGY